MFPLPVFLPNFQKKKKNLRHFHFPWVSPTQSPTAKMAPSPHLSPVLVTTSGGQTAKLRSVVFLFPPPKKKKALENVKNMQKPTYIMVVEVQSFCFREVFFFLLNSVFFLVCICFRVCLMMVSDLSSFHVVFIS